jgi:hypothetical protein
MERHKDRRQEDKEADLVEKRVLTPSSEILKWLRQLFWVACDGGLEKRFVVPVMDLLREFLEKISEGWKPCNLDYLEELKTGLIGPFHKLKRKVKEREREKVRILGDKYILPF